MGSAVDPSLAARVDEDHKASGYSRVQLSGVRWESDATNDEEEECEYSDEERAGEGPGPAVNTSQVLVQRVRSVSAA